MYGYSPLRYPGGKARVANFLRLLCRTNSLVDFTYVEPYAGGASVALVMLVLREARRVHINDLDVGVSDFWRCVSDNSEELCSLVLETPLTISEWKAQKAKWKDPSATSLERGFATFYLNRTNRSGIISGAGVIGGLEQRGQWGMDARFNREDLVKRIRAVARLSHRMEVTSEDAVGLLERLSPQLGSQALVYLDPPYYNKGQQLYRNAYEPSDHAAVAQAVSRLDSPWVVSYDDTPEIRELYREYRSLAYKLEYSAQKRYSGGEIMFFSHGLSIPDVTNPARIPQSSFSDHMRALARQRAEADAAQWSL